MIDGRLVHGNAARPMSSYSAMRSGNWSESIKSARKHCQQMKSDTKHEYTKCNGDGAKLKDIVAGRVGDQKLGLIDCAMRFDECCNDIRYIASRFYAPATRYQPNSESRQMQILRCAACSAACGVPASTVNDVIPGNDPSGQSRVPSQPI